MDAPGGELVLVGEVAPPSIATGTPECCADNNASRSTGSSSSHPPGDDLPGPLRNDAVAPPFPRAPSPTISTRCGPSGRARCALPHAGLVSIVTDIVTEERARMPRTRTTSRSSTGSSGGSRGLWLPVLRGKIVGLVPGFCAGKGPGRMIATSCIGAKLDFVAHEAGHGLGLAHAHGGTRVRRRRPRRLFDGPLLDARPDQRRRPRPPGLVRRSRRRCSSRSGPRRRASSTPPPTRSQPSTTYMSYCSTRGPEVFPGTTWVALGYWATTARSSSAAGGSTPASPAAAASSAPPPIRRCAGSSEPAAAAAGRSWTCPRSSLPGPKNRT